MQVVSIPSETSYYTIYELTGIPATEDVLLTNNTSSAIQVSQSVAPPRLSTYESFPLYPMQSIVVKGKGLPVWVQGKTGPLVVQELANAIVPYTGADVPNNTGGVQESVPAPVPLNFVEETLRDGTRYQFTLYNPTFAAGATRDLVIQTGNNPILMMNRYYQFDSPRITTTVYRNPNYNTAGNIVPYYTTSGLYPPASGTLTIRDGVNTIHPGNQISPTMTMLGSASRDVRACTPAGVENDVECFERVLASGASYLVRVTNPENVACRLHSLFTWYDGKHPV